MGPPGEPEPGQERIPEAGPGAFGLPYVPEPTPLAPFQAPQPPAQRPSAWQPPAPRPPTSRGPALSWWLALALGVGALVVAVAVYGVVRLRGDGSGARPVVAGTRTTAPVPPRVSPSVASPNPTPPPSRPATPSATAPPQVPAVIPGWTAVAGRELVAYDVPEGWKVASPDTLVGFESPPGVDPRQLVIMHDVASYKLDVCPETPASSRARAGFVSTKEQSPARAGADLSKKWAQVAALGDGGPTGLVGATTSQQILLDGGRIEATRSTTTMTPVKPAACDAPSTIFTAISFTSKGRVVVFMIFDDRGTAEDLPDNLLEAIIASLRPIGP